MALVAVLLDLVGPDVDGGAHDHLSELQRGDDHGDEFRNVDAERFQGIVGVHDGVNQVVHADEPAGCGDVVGVRVPGVQEHGHVVVPVQEDERLLPEHDEDGVTELGNLRQREHPVPEASYAVVQETGSGDAQRVHESICRQHVCYFWDGSRGPPN